MIQVLRRAPPASGGSRAGRAVAWVGAPLAGALAGVAATVPALAAALVGALVAAAVLVNGRTRRSAPLLVAWCLVLAGTVNLPALEGVGDVLRVVGIVLLVGAMGRSAAPPPAAAAGAGRPWPALLAVGYLGYAVAATVPHEQVLLLAAHLLSLVAVVLLVRATARRGAADTVAADSLTIVLTVIVGVSLALGLVGASDAFGGERLRGVVVNANTLAFYSLCLAVVAVVSRWPKPVAVPVVVACVGVIAWSGSRTSGVAVLVLVLVAALLRVGHARTLVAVAGAPLLVQWLAGPRWGRTDDLLILRSDNSRRGSAEEARSVLETRPLFGIGSGAESQEVASSVLRAVVHGGVVGVSGVLLIYVAAVAISVRTGPRSVAVVCTAAVHSLGEGWVLSAVSPLTLLVVVAWFVARGYDVADRQDPPAAPHAVPGPAPGGARPALRAGR